MKGNVSQLPRLELKRVRSGGWSRTRRVLGMAAVWLGMGLAAGSLTAPMDNPIDVIAGGIAGAVVLTPLGVSLVLLGGRSVGSLVGGIVGAGAGPVADLLGLLPEVPSPAAFGLIAGGIAGATALTVLFHIPRRLLALVRPRQA